MTARFVRILPTAYFGASFVALRAGLILQTCSSNADCGTGLFCTRETDGSFLGTGTCAEADISNPSEFTRFYSSVRSDHRPGQSHAVSKLDTTETANPYWETSEQWGTFGQENDASICPPPPPEAAEAWVDSSCNTQWMQVTFVAASASAVLCVIVRDRSFVILKTYPQYSREFAAKHLRVVSKSDFTISMLYIKIKLQNGQIA